MRKLNSVGRLGLTAPGGLWSQLDARSLQGKGVNLITGRYGADLPQAFDTAVSDGVHVINCYISGNGSAVATSAAWRS